MFSFVPHNSFLRVVVASIMLVLVSATARAQDDEDTSGFDNVYTEGDTVVVESADSNPKFDSITANNLPSYQPYSIPDSTLNAIKNEDAFWYACGK